jgi:hypothetical protein
MLFFARQFVLLGRLQTLPFQTLFILIVLSSCGNKYFRTNFISAVPTSLLIAPGLRTILFLFFDQFAKLELEFRFMQSRKKISKYNPHFSSFRTASTLRKQPAWPSSTNSTSRSPSATRTAPRSPLLRRRRKRKDKRGSCSSLWRLRFKCTVQMTDGSG